MVTKKTPAGRSPAPKAAKSVPKTPAVKPAAKKAPVAKVTAKPTAKAAVKSIAKPAAKAAPAGEVKPVKEAFTKAGLITHLAAQSGIEAKDVKKVLAALEASVVGSMHKKGLGSFVLPGLLKVLAVKVPATKKRFGVNPFTKVEQWFPAKPATVRVKVRPLKKLKDAAI